jgi:CMP/dCMP kinase
MGLQGGVEPNRPAGITVAISRQRGSGGTYVGRQVAHCLGLKYVDRELLRDAAEFLHKDESSRTPRQREETSWWARLGNACALGGPEMLYVPPAPAAVYEGDLFEREDRLIREIVADHVAVIVGRGVAQLLRGRREVVAVFVHAPERWRADRIRQVYGVADPAAALRMVQESDRERARFVRRLAGVDWTDARHYDLAIDTAATGFGAAVDVIVRAVAARLEPRETAFEEAGGA